MHCAQNDPGSNKKKNLTAQYLSICVDHVGVDRTKIDLACTHRSTIISSGLGVGMWLIPYVGF